MPIQRGEAIFGSYASSLDGIHLLIDIIEIVTEDTIELEIRHQRSEGSVETEQVLRM